MIWLALTIGNSRLHWAWFCDRHLQATWHQSPLTDSQLRDWPQYIDSPPQLSQCLSARGLSLSDLPLYVASVVPLQTARWATRATKILTLADVPLADLYPTLGIDRALAIFGAGEHYGYPVLVIDGGTALTVTGVDDQRRLRGGAISPGLRLQLQALNAGTAALPALDLPAQIPPLWSRDTTTAILSGVLHSVIGGLQYFIQDWQQQFPQSQVVITGGDGQLLQQYLGERAIKTTWTESLIHLGIARII